MKIRQTNNNDIPELENLNSEYTYDTFLTHLKLFPTLNYVAEQDNKIVGYILVQIQDKVEAHITSIVVHPDYRRRRIGKSLIITMLVAAKKLKLLSSSLHVNVNNAGAIKLYNSVGFITIRKKKEYYRDGDALLMRRRF